VPRIEAAKAHGEVLLDSRTVAHPSFPTRWSARPAARHRQGRASHRREWFGPIAFLVPTDSTVDSVAVFRRIVGAKAR